MQNGAGRPPKGRGNPQGSTPGGQRNPGRGQYGQQTPRGQQNGYGSRQSGYGQPGYNQPGYNQPRQRPMTEKEYRAYQQRQAATAEQRRRQAEVERMMRKQEVKRRRQRNRQVFAGRLAVFGAVLLIMGLIAGGIFLILFLL